MSGSAPDNAVVAGAILAGGRARRLGGVAKGLETVGGQRIVDSVVGALRTLASEIVLVGASPEIRAALPDLRAIADEAPGAGPLGGIISALHATRRDTLVVAWDMLFLREADVRALLDAPPGVDAVVPDCEGQLEPLCALYRASALPTLERVFAEGERSALGALRRLHIHRVVHSRTDAASFASINTPEQLAAARTQLRLPTRQREFS